MAQRTRAFTTPRPSGTSPGNLTLYLSGLELGNENSEVIQIQPPVSEGHACAKEMMRRHSEGGVALKPLVATTRTYKRSALSSDEELQQMIHSSPSKRMRISSPEIVIDSESRSGANAASSGDCGITTLVALTQRFLDLLLVQRDGVIDLNAVSGHLEVPKRRMYDVTNVLEGIGLIQKTAKNLVQWCAQTKAKAFSRLFHLRQDLDSLEDEEQLLDKQLMDAKIVLSDKVQHNRRLYLTHSDLTAMNLVNKNEHVVVYTGLKQKQLLARPHQTDSGKYNQPKTLNLVCSPNDYVNVQVPKEDGTFTTLSVRSTTVAHFHSSMTPYVPEIERLQAVGHVGIDYLRSGFNALLDALVGQADQDVLDCIHCINEGPEFHDLPGHVSTDFFERDTYTTPLSCTAWEDAAAKSLSCVDAVIQPSDTCQYILEPPTPLLRPFSPMLACAMV